MDKELHNPMQCSQFEALLSDALDGILSPEASEAFETHSQTCPVCGPQFAEAKQGMFWLGTLHEIEPPKNLLHNILAATTMADAAKPQATPIQDPSGWAARMWKKAWPDKGGAMQPRFVTSFAMAFFSLSLTFSLTGVRLDKVDWHPQALKKSVVLQYTQVENRVVKYYANMRLVYEIESRVRELRKAAGPSEDQGKAQEPPKEKKHKDDNDDTSGRPENRREQYSQELDNGTLAYLKTSNEGA
jgi:hypothetical protein